MKIIENFENNNNKLDLEKLKEFDEQKTRVFKYITYKKRTEQEIRNKFKGQIKDQMLEDIIDYLKESNYINDNEFIEKQVREFINLKTMSITEIKYKLIKKGLDKRLVEKYIENNYEELKEYEQRCIEKIKNKKAQTMEEQDIKMYLYKKGYKCD